MFLLGSCLRLSPEPQVTKVTDNVYVLKGAGSTSKLREKLLRRTGSDAAFISRVCTTVNLSDPCTVLSPDGLNFYLVPVNFSGPSQTRLAALLERLPTSGVLAMTLTGVKQKTSEYLFICTLVNYIRDKSPRQSIDSAAFDFLERQTAHRSVFRMAEVVRTLTSSRMRDNGNFVVQLNHVIISGLPLDRVTLHLIPSVYGNAVVRYFDSAGNVSLTLQMRPSESFLILVTIGGARILCYELVGLNLYENPFQVIGRGEFNPKLEIFLPLPDSFSLTVVGEVLTPATRTMVESTSPRGDTEKRQLVLAALPVFPATEASGEECQICMEAFRAGETLQAFPCLHHFHRHCVEEWTRVRLQCPNCRCDAYNLLQRARDA